MPNQPSKSKRQSAPRQSSAGSTKSAKPTTRKPSSRKPALPDHRLGPRIRTSLAGNPTPDAMADNMLTSYSPAERKFICEQAILIRNAYNDWKRRTKLKLSDLREIGGVSKQSFYGYVNARNVPSVIALKRMAKTFGVEIQELIPEELDK